MKKLNLTSVLFFLGPILATIMGMISVHYFDIPVRVFYTNIVGIVIGIPVAMLIAFKWKKRVKKQLVIAAGVSIALLGSCFLFPGNNMVYRWVMLSEVNINVSMIVLPIILYCIHQLLREKFYAHAIFILGITGVIISMQPDAGQATAFGIAAFFVFILNKEPWFIRVSSWPLIAVFVFMAWNRVDLLEPVDYVEDILSMIWDFGPVGYAALAVVTFSVIFPFIFFAVRGSERALSVAFASFFITQLVVTEIGNYPVPLLGAGASAVLGWYLMLGFSSSTNNIHL